MHHLKKAFSRLQQHRQVLNAEKCNLGVTGFSIWNHPSAQRCGCHMSLSSLQKRPTFLGMMNFYGTFIRSSPGALKPFTNALHGAERQKAQLSWSRLCCRPLWKKKQMVATMFLAHPDRGAHLTLSIDTSGMHVGVTLLQETPVGILLPQGLYPKHTY